jgi:hypothetical protein
VVTFTAELWLHEGGSWHFVSVPLDLSDDIKAEYGGMAGGFGSLRVEATIGGSTWRTSVFPSKTGEYVLPVKQQVRRAEQIQDGDAVEVSLRVL